MYTRARSAKRRLAPVVGLLATSLAGCGDLLEENPLGTLASSNFYRNGADAVAAVNAAYQGLHLGGAGGYLVSRNYVFLLESASPQVVAYSGPTSVRGCWDVYMCTPTNDEYAQTSWTTIYQAINRANAVTDNVPGIEMDAALRERILAEAKFLRAFHYFNLVRLFGGVPLRIEETKSLKELEQPRASADEVYNQIIKDLQEAITALPTSYPAREFGRATKGAAQALLGKVYLQRGIAGRTNPFGNPLYWPTGQASDVGNAITQLRAVASSGTYRLVTNYGDLWNESTERNPEVIWSVQNIDQGGQSMDASNYLAPNNSGWINSWTSAGAELPFWQSYAAGDRRRDVTWLKEYTDQNGRSYVWDINARTRWPHAAPQLRKYLIERRDVTNNPRDLVVLRYGDVLLMLAEAINDQSGPTGEAYDLVNQVRARAGLGPLESGLSKAAFREALYWERNWELATEQHAWFDGQRFWDLMSAHLITNAQLGLADPLQYPRRSVPEMVPAIQEPKSRLMPIPLLARDLNPQLTQNPGY